MIELKKEVNSNTELAPIDVAAQVIVDERDAVYGKAWQKMRIEHIIDEIIQKAERVQFMPDGKAKYEQALDIINYGRFLAWRLKHQSE